MSADLLRRAAAKLREHAEKATKGPWVAEDDGLIWNGDRALDPVAGSQFEENGEYIALMHPPVALALADVLLHAAQRFEQAHGGCLADGWDHAGHPSCPNRPKDIDRIIVLAREILREPS